MEFDKLIYYRESVRDYDPEQPVKKETLMKILDAGRIAPSAGNRQPWDFIVVSSSQKLKEVKQCYDRSWFHDAPSILLVKGFFDQAWVGRSDHYNSLETDLTIAMDHMILAATNEGVGSCWIIAYDPVILNRVMNIKENEKIYAITPLGYPRKGYVHREKKRKKLEDIVTFL